MTNHSCLDCKWARWQRTKSGRLKTTVAGQCIVPSPEIAHLLPRSVTMSWDFGSRFNLDNRTAIWASEPFTECPTWKAKHD